MILNWISLLMNICFMFCISKILSYFYYQIISIKTIILFFIVMIILIGIRCICTYYAQKMSFQSTSFVKQKLRQMMYIKLLKLGGITDNFSSSEIVQIMSEGVEQLENYFGSYLPQFFYAILAPCTLFLVLAPIDLKSAFILFICVPLIPFSIIIVQKWAKKLLSKYWNQYTSLGDSFLENLQGMTTLKVFQADAYKQEQMKIEAENFRKITMRVLTMQLNSITIMDFVAYGGASLGMIFSLFHLQNGSLSIFGCLFILLCSADFFLPMRLLGSFFHIAMNGLAASEKIFVLLNQQEQYKEISKIPSFSSIQCQHFDFSYDEKNVLHDINFEMHTGQLISIVGPSGCGKSTFAKIIAGILPFEKGKLTISNINYQEIQREAFMKSITYVPFESYIFKGSVKDNLKIAKDTEDFIYWKILEQVQLKDFLLNENGLETQLLEDASNLSGGQKQRLALARALLHDSEIYIFDEATSNIDMESEEIIMHTIQQLSKEKTILLISHRLMNVVSSDCIYVMNEGSIVEKGKHGHLLQQNGLYASLWKQQQALENYAGGLHEKE
ncbi:MAG: ABC transporter ATP-binding protein/permease [Floccifex sp.]